MIPAFPQIYPSGWWTDSRQIESVLLTLDLATLTQTEKPSSILNSGPNPSTYPDINTSTGPSAQH